MIFDGWVVCFMLFGFSVDSGFDEYDIFYDVLWLDIEYIDGKKYDILKLIDLLKLLLC